MKPDVHQVSLQLAGTEVTVETGRIARQASGSALVRCGDDVLLATVVVGAPREGTDFFPLTVEYREKFAAAGRIPGSFQRREGRISDHEVLMSRIVDRTIRSLFPKGYRAEVQLQIAVFSADPASDLSTLALIGGCAALHLSCAPAAGPAAGLRIVRRHGVFNAFPTETVRAEADLDFVVSAGPDGLVMVEGGAREIDESACVDALAQAEEWAARIRKALDELRTAAGVDKDPVPEPSALPELPATTRTALEQALRIARKQERNAAIDAARDELFSSIADDEDADRTGLAKAFDKARSEIVREHILGGGARLDGRGLEDIRPIWTEVGWLPRTHGSSIFTRGETQALVTCTLGTAEEAQRIDGLAGLRDEPFLLHYNFPPYSVGEVRPLRGPGRREIGHGFLARRGLEAVLPSFDDFPYTIRIESEISESNGSSSMATACGGSLALMHAGVPLRRPVAGIAMGLVTDGERTAVLSDILGDEDHLGDMDFKVVGTEEGVTALQLDNKVGGLTREQLATALDQAKRGRLHILGEMAQTIEAASDTVSSRAPQVLKTQILPESVAVLIGPRGQTIKGIAAATGAKVNVDDDGVVRIYAADETAARKALQMVGRTAGVVKRGAYYRGTVSGFRDFGVFVRLNDVVEGLVPRDELFERTPEGRQQAEKQRFENGDEMLVRVIGIDDRNRLRLSRRAAIDVDEALLEW